MAQIFVTDAVPREETMMVSRENARVTQYTVVTPGGAYNITPLTLAPPEVPLRRAVLSLEAFPLLFSWSTSQVVNSILINK